MNLGEFIWIQSHFQIHNMDFLFDLMLICSFFLDMAVFLWELKALKLRMNHII